MSATDNVQAQPQGNMDLLPRKYQEEVFERAQKGNVIAALSTGSGKTLISVLLVKWIASRQEALGKVIVFLVPMVTLVEQQADYLSLRTPLRISRLYGAQTKDLSDRVGWAKRFADSDVLVMTAQIFLNILTHSLWSIDKVSLMVFDECHHARKNHPYNGILREYFQVTPPQRRPKIFGMTASPIWSIKHPQEAIDALERNMDAKVISVHEHVEELIEYMPKTNELIREYTFPPEEYNYPSPTIYQCFKVIDDSVWDQLDILWPNIEIRYHMTLSNLGPYCASLVLYSEIQRSVETILVENRSQLMNDHSNIDGMDAMTCPAPHAKKLPDDLYLIIDILHNFDPFFPSSPTTATIPFPISLDWYTPKVATLVDILLEYYTPTFQGIIFVEQRQVAFALSRILEAIPELCGKIRSAFLVGQGVDSKGLSNHYQRDTRYSDPIKHFRAGTINILIATSVAEEGLDFPACDLVVRFDPLHHMIGYVQSRGRARNKASTFIVLIQEDDMAQREKYQKLQEKEPELNQVYQTRHLDSDKAEVSEDDGEDDTNPTDLIKRERYVVPSTGAVLTYDNSLTLLNYLCSLIPRDAFTPVHAPKYTGEFQATLHLPRTLPLDPLDLIHVGPPRQTKKEARRAVSFLAVKRLRNLDVFDEYLLPVAKYPDDDAEFDVKRSYVNRGHTVADISPLITTSVKDPWCIGHKLWIHPIVIDDQTVAGLITGTSLHADKIIVGGRHVRVLSAELLNFDEDSEHQQRNYIKEFTRLGIWYNNTSSPFPSSLSFYIVPLTAHHRPDFEAIRLLLDNPRGSNDWSQISQYHTDKLMVLNANRFGSTYMLRRIRHDLTPLSRPPRGSREDGYPTYRDYWLFKWGRKARPAAVPPISPLLETTLLARSNMFESCSLDSLPVQSVCDGCILPQSACSWLAISDQVRQAFRILPTLSRHLTDAYRARCARSELGLPLIPVNLLIEAFTIPSAMLAFNNQRMETLGDAVLQLCTTVHLLNKYPNRHEGQLSTLRKQVVSNRHLRLRALDLGLQHFVNSEVASVYKWRYTLSDQVLPYPDPTSLPSRFVTREYPIRSLQDCMEALLGASYIAGGISLALQTGAALGLEFGGPVAWPIRYCRDIEPSPVAALFGNLENSLGYNFRHNHLLVESLTHPSFSYSDGPSYQRLEFLGDAILDLVVLRYLYDKFPNATSHQLALPRTKAICAPTLANLAVRRLDLHRMMLSNSLHLSLAIDSCVPILQGISAEEIVKSGWKHDPPKALSDVFESIIGAVLVDSGYDYEKTAAVVEYVMDDVLEALSPDVDKDPVSEVVEWMASAGCNLINFEKRKRKTEHWEREGIIVLVHGEVVVGPIVATTLTVAKFLAAERALAVLQDSKSEKSLRSLCDCAMSMKGNIQGHSNHVPIDVGSSSPLDKFDLSNSEGTQEVAMMLTQVEELMIKE